MKIFVKVFDSPDGFTNFDVDMYLEDFQQIWIARNNSSVVVTKFSITVFDYQSPSIISATVQRIFRLLVPQSLAEMTWENICCK